MYGNTNTEGQRFMHILLQNENWTHDHFPEEKNKQANKTKTVIRTVYPL